MTGASARRPAEVVGELGYARYSAARLHEGAARRRVHRGLARPEQTEADGGDDMSEIPYVKQLGDAFDEAIADGARARRRRHGSAGGANSRSRWRRSRSRWRRGRGGLFTDPVEIGFGTCVLREDGAERQLAIISDPPGRRSTCAHTLPASLEAHDLIACQWPGPRGGGGARESRPLHDRGLAPVPPSTPAAPQGRPPQALAWVERGAVPGARGLRARLTAELRVVAGRAGARLCVWCGPCGGLGPSGSEMLGRLDRASTPRAGPSTSRGVVHRVEQ